MGFCLSRAFYDFFNFLCGVFRQNNSSGASGAGALYTRKPFGYRRGESHARQGAGRANKPPTYKYGKRAANARSLNFTFVRNYFFKIFSEDVYGLNIFCIENKFIDYLLDERPFLYHMVENITRTIS